MSLSRQARLKFWIELFRGVMQKPPIREILPVFVAKAIYSFACLGVPLREAKYRNDSSIHPCLRATNPGP